MKRESFELPSRILLWVGIWLVPGLLQCVQEVTYARAHGASTATARVVLHFLPAWLPWAAFTPLVLALARRFPFRVGTWLGSLGVHLVGALVFGAAHLLILGLVRTNFPPGPWVAVDLETWMTQTFWSLHAQVEVLAYFGIVVAGHALQALRTAREREVRTLRLEAQLTAARLGALQEQLQPHFLFNTLNAIDVLIDEDQARAKRIVLRLGELLRRTLETGGAEQTVREELEHLECYLDIERERFSDRLCVQVEADDAVAGLLVPSLVLQPLVENALRHGIAPQAEGGTVEIQVRREGERLELSVADDGVGLAGFAGEGVGLGNTRARVRELYGEEARLSLGQRSPRGALVQLSIPARALARAAS